MPPEKQEAKVKNTRVKSPFDETNAAAMYLKNAGKKADADGWMYVNEAHPTQT